MPAVTSPSPADLSPDEPALPGARDLRGVVPPDAEVHVRRGDPEWLRVRRIGQRTAEVGLEMSRLERLLPELHGPSEGALRLGADLVGHLGAREARARRVHT